MSCYCSRSSRSKLVLDLLHFLNLVYIAVAVPLQISFIDDVNVCLGMEVVSMSICAFVIVVNLRTPLVGANGQYTLNFWFILKNYLQGDMVFDVLAMLPVNTVLAHFHFEYPVIILATLLRVSRVIGIYQMLYLFEKFEIYLKNMHILMYIFKSLLNLFLLWHWTSCTWYYLNKRIESELFEDTWYRRFNLQEQSLGQQYLFTMYFVMKVVTGVG